MEDFWSSRSDKDIRRRQADVQDPVLQIQIHPVERLHIDAGGDRAVSHSEQPVANGRASTPWLSLSMITFSSGYWIGSKGEGMHIY
jgi:hypothetical protein